MRLKIVPFMFVAFAYLFGSFCYASVQIKAARIEYEELNKEQLCSLIFENFVKGNVVDIEPCYCDGGNWISGRDMNLVAGMVMGESNYVVGGTIRGKGGDFKLSGVVATNNLELDVDTVIFDGIIAAKGNVVINAKEVGYTPGTMFFGNGIWLINGIEFGVNKQHELIPVERDL